MLLQLVIEVAAAPLKKTELLPCVAPKLVPLIVTDAPIPPNVGDIPLIFGVGGGVPAVTVTLSNVAVASCDVLLLVTPMPTYTLVAMLIVTLLPICVQ